MNEHPRDCFLRFKTRMHQRMLAVIDCTKKTPQIASGFCLAWICFANPANALNGNNYVTSCACKTTADFASAAKNQATLRYTNTNSGKGLYTISSTTSASSAYMSVTGKFVTIDGDPTWVATAALPIDANGNSIAGLPESAQEAIYSAIDSTIMGANRNYAAVIVTGPANPGGHPTAIPDFPGATDQEIENGLVIDDPNVLDLPDGATVTIEWYEKNGDHIVLTYKVSTVFGWHLVYQDSATKNGQPINRDGSPKKNPNTSGSGGGADTVGGFGAGAGDEWTLGGHDSCYVSAFYEAPDGTIVGSGSWAPC